MIYYYPMLGSEVLPLAESRLFAEPIAFADPGFRRLGYRLWLPEGQNLGCIQVFANRDDGTRFVPEYIEGSDREIRQLNILADSGLRASLEAVGYQVMYDTEHRSGYATYPSSEFLEKRFSGQTQSERFGLPLFRVHDS